MKIITEPTVYLIGKQTVVDDELKRFLDDHGITWQSDSESAGEVIAETSGRLCYMSYKSPRPGGNKAYLGHIIESQHGSVLSHAVFNFMITGVSRSLCYLPGTEVLTDKGWDLVENLKSGDTLLTKCPETGVCRWSKNKKLLTMQHDGMIHWFENSEWKSPGFTSDHLVWVAKYDLRKCRDMSCRDIADKFCEKVPFNQVEGKRLVVDHEIRTNGDNPSVVNIGQYQYPAKEFFEWLGWCLTDGGASKSRKMCYVTQTKQVGWNRICQLMDTLFSDRWKRQQSTSGQNVARISDPDLWQYICDKFGRLKKSRRLTSLFTYSRDLIESFLDGVVGGDGNIHPESGHTVVYCNNLQMAGDLQVLFSMCGKSGCVRVFANAGRKHYLNNVLIKSNQPEVLVSVHKTTASLINSKHQHKVWYRGLVHCPETDDGLVYVRRNGHGVWSGNTHELIRHSVGTATSQLSQRYVDESVAEYVCPPDLKDEVSDGLNLWLGFWDKCDFGQDEYDCIKDDDYSESTMIGVEWINAISTMHRAYGKISDYLTRKAEKRGLVKTDARKFARQAARSVLPNATETKLMFTANVRAIRNILEQRGSRHAEPEIRKLAKAIFDIVIVEAPAMFSDYQLEQLPDGTYEITTQYRKV